MGKIRLLHLADIHLGVETYGRIDPATGLNTRLGDFTACLDEAVEYAITQGVDLVVFAGDAYRSRDPNQTYQREFALRIKRLSQAGVPVFLLVGNHDLPVAIGRANAVDIFETLAVDNVYVGRRRDLHTVSTRNGPVQVVAVPWLAKNVLLSKEDYKALKPEEVNQLMADSTTAFIEQAVARLDRSLPAILVGHASVLGATFGSEKSVTMGQDFVMPKAAIANQVFDYVALGHMHKHQVLGNSPLIVYSGSINRVDFGEEKEDKGFVIVELEKGTTSYRFVPVKARRFLTIEVDADCAEPTEKIIAAIESSDITDAIVRVIIKTTLEREAEIKFHEVRKALREAYHLAAISRQVQNAERMVFAERMVEEMTPIEALEAYLKNKQTAPERQGLLIDYAKKIMAGLE